MAESNDPPRYRWELILPPDPPREPVPPLTLDRYESFVDANGVRWYVKARMKEGWLYHPPAASEDSS
jgi:hypothetical protein